MDSPTQTAPPGAGEPPPAAPTLAQRIAEHRVWLVFCAALGLLLFYTREVVFVFLLAYLISYTLNPLVVRLQKLRLPRGLAVLVVFLVFGGAVALVGQLAVPQLISQGENAVESLKKWGDNLPQYLDEWDAQIRERPKIRKMLQFVNPDGHLPDQEELMAYAKPYLGNFASGLAAFGGRLAGTLPYLILLPILIAYILSDYATLHAAFWRLVPRRHHDEVAHVSGLLEKATVNYLKGYVKLALIVSLLVTTVLAILGVPYALLFGFIAFFMEFLPYIGPLIMAVPPIIVAATSGHPWLGVVIFFGCLQILEGQVLAPRIVGQESGLHPLMIVFALLVGGQVAGIVGMLTAIPLLSFAKQLMLHYMEVHRVLVFEPATEPLAVEAEASTTEPSS